MSASEATATAYLTTLYGGTTTYGEGGGTAEDAGANISTADDGIASSIKALADQGISGTIEQTSVAKFGMQLHEFEWEDDVRLRF